MEKKWTIDEIFCGMPLLKAYFKELERTIKTFRKRKDNPQLTRELLERKKDVLLQTAQSLTRIELKIVYYLRSLTCVKMRRLFHTLQDFYRAECRLKNAGTGENAYFDIVSVCIP